MGRYLKKNHFWPIAFSRLCETALTVWAVLTFTFFSLRFLPGGPFTDHGSLSPELQAALNQQYGLDLSLLSQYSLYLKNLLTLNLGESLQNQGVSVTTLLQDRIFVSFELGIFSIVLVLCGGLTLGLTTGAWPRVDRFLFPFLTAGVSLPHLLVGPCLVYVFSRQWELFPPALIEGPSSWVLPIVALSIKPLCQIAKMLRGEVRETMTSEFIRAARAKGLSEGHIFVTHILKISMLPLLGFMGPMFANILSGSLVTEMIFAIPGLGTLFINSLNQRDYPVIIGATLIYLLWLLPILMLSDFFLRVLDPRIHSE